MIKTTKKKEINRSVILARALLCISQAIIVYETWDLLRGTQEGTQDLSFEKETQTGFTVFIRTYIKRYIHTIAWKNARGGT